MIEVLVWCDECNQVIETGKNLRCVRARAGNRLTRIGKKDFHAECLQAKKPGEVSGKGNKTVSLAADSQNL